VDPKEGRGNPFKNQPKFKILNVIKCLRAEGNMSHVFEQYEVIVTYNVAFNG